MMRKIIEVSGFVTAISAVAGVAHAGIAPAPLLGAGPVGLAVLAVAGGGYVAVRALRKRR